MRYLFSILCFFTAACSFAQEIELQGRYGASFIGGESINFVGKDSFYLDGFYCTHGVKGKGTCEIRDNMLYLFFEKGSKKQKEAPSKKWPVIEMSDNKDGAYELNISCEDTSAKPVAFATVYLKKRNGTTARVNCDSAGRASYRISNAELPLQIEAAAVGFKSEKLSIDSAVDYNIRIFQEEVVPVITELNKGQVWTYEIGELSEDLILMRPAKGGEGYRHYKKYK